MNNVTIYSFIYLLLYYKKYSKNYFCVHKFKYIHHFILY